MPLLPGCVRIDLALGDADHALIGADRAERGAVGQRLDASRCRPTAALRRPCASVRREIQLHADAVGIVEEDLRRRRCAASTCSRNFTFLDLSRLRTPADVGGGEGDVVEAAGVLELLLGAAHDDALARLARAQQVHGRRRRRNRASSRGSRAAGGRRSRGPAPRNRTSWCARGWTVRWCSAAVRQAAWCRLP